jgi:hypothetical protein
VSQFAVLFSQFFSKRLPYFSIDNAHLMYNARVIYIKNRRY